MEEETTKEASHGSAAQRPAGRGTARWTDWKATPVTAPAGEQVMWDQLQGDGDDGDQSGGRAGEADSHEDKKAASEFGLEAESVVVTNKKKKRLSKMRRKKKKLCLC